LLANILVEPGRIELREIRTPRPSAGEILVRIKAALTCGTDLKAFRRGHPVIPMPGVFGHEFSGIVAATGKDVKKFREGDAIMAVHSAPCLECSYCRKKLYNLCEKIMHTKILGAFAEYILLPAHIVRQNAFHKPEGLPFEEAALLEPLSCVVHGLEYIRPKKNEHALVIGAGPIGLLHLLLLKDRGLKVSIADKHDPKLEIAREFGADSVSKAHRINALKESANNGVGFDYVFECTGMPEVWESSVNYIRRGGTVILFGGCKSETKVTYDTGKLHYDEITLKGVFHYAPSDVKKAYTLLCAGRLAISKFITGRYPLARTQKAFDKLLKGVGIKYAIIP
jgi:L-iditol 2-dehydrogenase